MSKPLVVGNWKTGVVGKKIPSTQNHLQIDSVLTKEIVAAAKDSVSFVNLVLCPPFTSLNNVKVHLENSGIFLGTQNVAHLPENEFAKPVTGEIPIFMLEGIVSYSIIGHSERRNHCGEDWHTTIAKFTQLIKNQKITPIVCLSEHGNSGGNLEKAKQQVKAQVAQLIEAIQSTPEVVDSRLAFAIAYEPAWAIGGDAPADTDYVRSMTDAIRQELSTQLNNTKYDQDDIPIIYGGSVSAATAYGLAELNNVDGFLLGRASLDVAQFMQIVSSVVRAHKSKNF